MTAPRMAKLALASAAAVAAWLFVFFGPTGIRQARWLAESREVLPVVESRLASDARFAGLQAFVSSGCNVVVFGRVGSESESQEVRRVLQDIPFPHGVIYLVRVE